MHITYTVQSLDTADAWDRLAHALGDGHPEVVRSTIRHLRVLGARSFVLEDPATTPHPFDDDTIKRATSSGIVELNACQATFAVALMSPRVFSTAAAAEVSARDRIEETLTKMPDIRRFLVDRGLMVNDRLLDELQDAHIRGQIVLRTYLISAAGYRRHIADGTAGDDLKDALLTLHLPHFTWITEIATTDSYNHCSAGTRRVYGHTIIDATSTGRDGDGLLALHLPGLLVTKDVNAPPSEQDRIAIIIDDNLYECRAKNR